MYRRVRKNFVNESAAACILQSVNLCYLMDQHIFICTRFLESQDPMASRLERLVSIDAYIRSAHYPSVQKLCEMFEVQPRTIYQDLRELREMFDLDIRYDRERNGYFNADPSKQLPQLAMTYEEALLITLAVEMLAASFGPSFKGALTRTSEMLRANDDDRFAWLRDLIPLETPGNCEVKCSVLIAVLKAAMSGNRTKMILMEGLALKHFTAMPVKVLYSEGHWRLVSREIDAGNAKNGRQSNGLLEPFGNGHFTTPLCMVTDVELSAEEKKKRPAKRT